MNDIKDISDLNKILGDLNSMVEEGTGEKDKDIELIQESINSIQELDDIIKTYGTEERTFKTVTKYNNKSNNPNPVYAHVGDSGFDIRAHLNESITLKPLERKLIPTGLSFELSPNTELQIRPRSGMALKHGITVLNTPGTVDEGYRGDVGIIIVNISNEDYTIHNGDKIAQGVIMNVIGQGISELVNSEELSSTERGLDGFGSTGK